MQIYEDKKYTVVKKVIEVPGQAPQTVTKTYRKLVKVDSISPLTTTDYVLTIKRTVIPPTHPTPFYVEDASGMNSTLTIDTARGDVTNLEFSQDGENWTSIQPSLPANGRVYIRANSTYWCNVSSTIGCIKSNNRFKVGGNIMSLQYGNSFVGNETTFTSNSTYSFNRLFTGFTDLISAAELILPATTLAQYCYSAMFSGCTSLTTAPTLPATTLASNCYSNMFEGCTSLMDTQPLPATTLASNCYSNMFEGCTSLILAPTIQATTMTEGCCRFMFKDCSRLSSITCYATNPSYNYTQDWVRGVSSTGTFNKVANVAWDNGPSGAPNNWTVRDI